MQQWIDDRGISGRAGWCRGSHPGSQALQSGCAHPALSCPTLYFPALPCPASPDLTLFRVCVCWGECEWVCVALPSRAWRPRTLPICTSSSVRGSFLRRACPYSVSSSPSGEKFRDQFWELSLNFGLAACLGWVLLQLLLTVCLISVLLVPEMSWLLRVRIQRCFCAFVAELWTFSWYFRGIVCLKSLWDWTRFFLEVLGTVSNCWVFIFY